MLSYEPPYEITNEILSYVSSISEKIGKLSGKKGGLNAKPHLRKNNKIKSIYSSLRIEANSLPLGSVRDVIEGRAVLGTEKEIREVKNAYEAYEQISSIDPYCINDLKRIHGLMTRYMLDESGEFRLGEEGVFDGDKCIFMAPPAKLVPSQMNDLFEWMLRSKDKVHPLVLSSVFHYEFVFIHPFSDGNGRMARLWHTVILSKWNPLFEFIPTESQIEKFQDGYYKAIADCHISGNSTEFIEFILKQIDSILDEITALSDEFEGEISEYEKRLLENMDYAETYSANELLDLLGLKSKETLRKNYVGPALKHGAIIMTIPDKPNSKNQRYRKI